MGSTPGTRSLFKTATIANGQTVSDAVACEGLDVVALQFATMTGVAMTFQGSFDGTTYVAIADDAGAAISITIATDKYVMLNTALKQLRGMRFLKVVSGSAEGAARLVRVILADS